MKHSRPVNRYRSKERSLRNAIESEGGEDCLGVSCPLYQYMPYRKGRIKKQMTPERKAMALENLRKAREATILSSET